MKPCSDRAIKLRLTKTDDDFFETSETDYPVMRRRVPEELTPQQFAVKMSIGYSRKHICGSHNGVKGDSSLMGYQAVQIGI
jgi:hypothetical protein